MMKVSSQTRFKSCPLGSIHIYFAIRLEDAAVSLLGGLHERGTSGRLEDLTDTLVCTGRALKVLVSANLLADLLTL